MKKFPGGRLDLLYRISQTINSSLDPGVVMETLMDEVISATQAERGFLMLLDDEGELVFRTARGMDQRAIEKSEFEISRGVVDRVAREGIPLLTSNAQTDERLDMRASVKLYGLRSVLCVPIVLKDKVLGVIYVDNRFQNGIFKDEDLELLNSIASSAGIAIENARLYRIAVEKGRMERELQMARDVQRTLIPPDTPQLPGWEFAACWKPAHEVSGDYYDFIPLGSGRLGVVVADVSDKGMPAAMFMALSRSVIRSVAGMVEDPAEDIRKANMLIHRDAGEGMFITLFYAVFEADSGQLHYVNAGHNPPIIVRNATRTIEKLSRTGMAAGVERDTTYQSSVVNLENEDFLMIYTDGVTDSRKGNAEFGEERLAEALIENADMPPVDLINRLEEEVCDFSDDGDPVDDITLLMVKKTA